MHNYRILWSIVLLLLNIPSLLAQDGPPPYVQRAVRQVENYLGSTGPGATENFQQAAMVSSAQSAEWAARLNQLRQQLQNSLDGVGLQPDPEGFIMELSGPGGAFLLRVMLDEEEKKISNWEVKSGPRPISFRLATLSATFDSLAEEGLSGLFFYRLKGEIKVIKPFGMANHALSIPNTENTIFGIGSRPIDFTVAAIQLLDQQGKLSINDPITRFIDQVPSDKQSMTLSHLMTGQSGLPDFFETEDDWNPDLAWIDRNTAVQRMMNQTLLFTPGKDNAHSHGAFVLLSAIVEIVSETDYYTFIRQQFLDPAGMQRTGEYGETRGLSISDFAEGGGPEHIGLPNIPPNWGPTSWLVKGSGGMYSTLDDLRKFYIYLRSRAVLDESHQQTFRKKSVNLDGSMRGFELFSAYYPPDTELYLFLNETGDRSQLRPLFRGVEALLPEE